MKRAQLGARRYWPLWLAVLPLSAWALVRALGLDGDSKLALVIAFTPYAAIAALLLLGLCVALRNWAASLATASVCAVLAIAVLPRALGGGEEAPPAAARLTVLSANVYHGKADPKALLALVDRLQPDVLSVQELNRSLAVKLQRLGIARRLPESIVFVRPDVTGAGLYARHPLTRLPDPGGFDSRMLRARIEMPGGGQVRVIDVHPFTPEGDHINAWADELSALPSAGRGSPWLLIGDFNATLDHSELRDVLDRGYRDAGGVTGSGLVPTWPNNRSYPPLITIDHVLADQRLGVSEYGVEDLPSTDHRAIWARVFWPAGDL